MKGESRKMPQVKTVPNQRVITVNKELTDKDHLYTANNLKAVDEAAHYLKSKAGFKLYFYIAKNQNNYKFALSSTDFCNWASVSTTAYKTAFEELIEEGYLVLKEGEKNTYIFHDKSTIDLPLKYNDTTIVEYANYQ